MDYKQIKILNSIYKYFCLKNKKKIFIQHRNLNEFRHFNIERVNPNHRIFLYGQLKRHKVKDKQYNKFLKVGEIILYSGIFLLIPNFVLFNLFSGFIVFIVFHKLFLQPNNIKYLKPFNLNYKSFIGEKTLC